MPTVIPFQSTTERRLTTEELAQQLGVKPDTLRVGLCRKGHYFGLRPIKLPNRRLLWPSDSIERLTRLGQGSGEVALEDGEDLSLGNRG